MRLPRSSGILLHVTSLPGSCGAGDLGHEAHRFVDFLAATKQSVWQVLPLGPTGYGASPYQSPSAFAGNPLLVSLERLVDDGWLSSAALTGAGEFSEKSVDFERVVPWRLERLAEAAAKFARDADAAARAECARFRAEQTWWLEDYALFIALQEAHDGARWTRWAPSYARREPAALDEARVRLAERIDAETFAQFQFERQWRELKRHASHCDVRIMGDIPIFVSHDSADVWAHQDLFQLDSSGAPMFVAGVPPDYFSATGQLWGNPLYRWDVLAQQGYAWWIQRFRRALELLDLVRLDHFRGFEAYWEVPGDALDAIRGRWAPGPGAALFRAAEQALGPLPVVAEDLGLITPEVDALRHELGFPGMRVLQFAFGDDAKASDYKPLKYDPHTVVYTGTHDNDTVVGWFHSHAGTDTTRTAEQIERERRNVLGYLGTDGSEINWDMIRLAWSSVADTAMAPLQDVLGLGSEARMNLPGTATGNWGWRYSADHLTPDLAQRLLELTEVYERTILSSPDF